MEPKQTKDDRREEDEETHESDEGASVIEKDQTSFVDEKSPRGKQFGDGRKVADLGRVGGVSPDADSDEPAQQPKK